MSKPAPRIFLSAGEPSGDLHGAAVAQALKRRWPDAVLHGLGGDGMAAAGVTLMAHTKQLAVMGIVEVLRHLPFFIGLWQNVIEELRGRRYDLVIPIDYPGFNLRLARFAKRHHIPVLYFIAPQVWAWHRSRMRQLAENVDRLAVVLPFEADLFRAAGANVTFVGHPLVDLSEHAQDRDAFTSASGISADAPILALFPGSRLQEVRRQLDRFGEAARIVRQTIPELQPVVAAVPGISRQIYEQAGLRHTTDATSLLTHARAALVKSGTTTLQAALAGVPMVVTYQMHPLTFEIARTLVDVPHIALANLVAGERVVPELLQDEATPQALAAALVPLIGETPERARVLAGLGRVREKLTLREDGGTARTAAERVAALAAELIEQRR